jgi:hypothetical protein
MDASIATGVANAMEQEHATTRTAAVDNGFRLIKYVSAAIPPTIGRK